MRVENGKNSAFLSFRHAAVLTQNPERTRRTRVRVRGESLDAATGGTTADIGKPTECNALEGREKRGKGV